MQSLDDESRTATSKIITHSNKYVNCVFVVSDKIQKLFRDTSANHDMTDILLTNEELDRYEFDFKQEPIPDDNVIVYHQNNSLWRNIYLHIIAHSDLGIKENASMYCLNYMLMDEAWYSQIVDRVCYMLIWRTNPPTLDNLKR